MTMATEMREVSVSKSENPSYVVHLQSLSIKLAVSIPVIRKVAVVFLYVKIQKILKKDVRKT